MLSEITARPPFSQSKRQTQMRSSEDGFSDVHGIMVLEILYKHACNVMMNHEPISLKNTMHVLNVFILFIILCVFSNTAEVRLLPLNYQIKATVIIFSYSVYFGIIFIMKNQADYCCRSRKIKIEMCVLDSLLN